MSANTNNNLNVSKHSISARYAKMLDNNLSLCELCPNLCKIKLNKTGECKTRLNINGTLYSVVYGNPCAVHIDPIEKKPLYHFFPSSKTFSIAAAGCNLKCLNCQNWSISQFPPSETVNTELFPADVVENAIKFGTQSISFTYSEPVVFYEYMLDTAVIAREKGLKTIMVSNGYINKAPLMELAKYLDAANIDLKSFDNAVYQKLSKGRLIPVLDTLITLKEQGIWLEITNLLIPEWTDSPKKIKEMCQWLYANGFADTPVHFSRFSPMHELKHLPRTAPETIFKAIEIAKSSGLLYIYAGNLPGSLHESTYCPNCNSQIIERQGYTNLSVNLDSGHCKKCFYKIAGFF